MMYPFGKWLKTQNKLQERKACEGVAVEVNE
jgi:hypothetical protein